MCLTKTRPLPSGMVWGARFRYPGFRVPFWYFRIEGWIPKAATSAATSAAESAPALTSLHGQQRFIMAADNGQQSFPCISVGLDRSSAA